ncbi:MAG TPA: Clp protease N-terminal domain-containing protein [Candidatus Elarobacter sp.]|jgi:ATP-dependent Clp protease ATP-binding subunit ClpC
MWEPFSEPARHAIVRAQEVAQMFGARSIATAHIAFALAETDDDVGHLFATALDRAAMRDLLGSVSAAPREEMVFSDGAKRSIEYAFRAARQLGHGYIGVAHLAIGVLDSGDPPPAAPGVDVNTLRTELQRAAGGDDPSRN